jgi:hypothetical protein
VLREFRTRLMAGAAEQRLLDALLAKCRERKWLKARGRQRTDSTHVLARVRAVNRLEGVGETLRYALNTLAVVAPEWVQEHCPAEWVQRYGHRVDDTICRPTKTSATRMRKSLGWTAMPYWLPSMLPKRLSGFAKYPLSRPYDACGCSILSGSETGALAHGEGRHSLGRALYQFPV